MHSLAEPAVAGPSRRVSSPTKLDRPVDPTRINPFARNLVFPRGAVTATPTPPKKRGRPKGAKRLAREAEEERQRLARETGGGTIVEPERKKRGRPRKAPEDLAINKRKCKESSTVSVEERGSRQRSVGQVPQNKKRKFAPRPAESSASDSEVPATDEETQTSGRSGWHDGADAAKEEGSRTGKRQRPSYVALFTPVVDERPASSASPVASARVLAPAADEDSASDEVGELDLIDEPDYPTPAKTAAKPIKPRLSAPQLPKPRPSTVQLPQPARPARPAPTPSAPTPRSKSRSVSKQPSPVPRMPTPVLRVSSPVARPGPQDAESSRAGRERSIQSASPTPSASRSPSHRVDDPSRLPSMTDEELALERYNSTLRLLSTWEDIVNRYKDVPAEDDDEIDLQSGKLIRDRGKLKKMKGARRFGFFVGALHGEDDVEESSDDEPNSGDDADEDDQEEDDTSHQQPQRSTDKGKGPSRPGSRAGSRAGSRPPPPAAPAANSFFAPRKPVEIDANDLETFLRENKRLMGNFVDEDDDFEGIDEVTIYDGETDRESVYGRTDAEDSSDSGGSSDDDSGSSSDASASERGVNGAPAPPEVRHQPVHTLPSSEVLVDFNHDPIRPDRPSIPGYPIIDWHRQSLPTLDSLPLLHYVDLYAPGFNYGSSSWTSISPHVLFNVPRDHDPVNVPLGTNEPFVPEGLDLPEGSVVYRPSDVLVRTAAEARMYAVWKRDKMKRLWYKERERARAAEAKRLAELEYLAPVDGHQHATSIPAEDAAPLSQSQPTEPTSSFFSRPDPSISTWAADLATTLRKPAPTTTLPTLAPMAEFYPPQPNLCRVCLAYGRDLVASLCPGGTSVHRCTGGSPSITSHVFPKRCVRCLFQGREDLARGCRGRKEYKKCIYGAKEKSSGLGGKGERERVCERCRREGREEEMWVCRGRIGGKQWNCDKGREAMEGWEREQMGVAGEERESEEGGSESESEEESEDGGGGGDANGVVVDLEDEESGGDETTEEEEEDEWVSDESSDSGIGEGDESGDSASGSDGGGESRLGQKGKGKAKQRPVIDRPKRSLPRKSYVVDEMFPSDVVALDEMEMETEEDTTESDSD